VARDQLSWDCAGQEPVTKQHAISGNAGATGAVTINGCYRRVTGYHELTSTFPSSQAVHVDRRSKTDAEREGAEMDILRGQSSEASLVAAL
jgi:hypothetical protein